jgi:AcrR family transcriptional regulator
VFAADDRNVSGMSLRFDDFGTSPTRTGVQVGTVRRMARVPADVRRQELIDAAIRVMARDGVAKATTRAIVTEADMQLGFFHYCFRSKEELLRQVIDTINDHNIRAALAVVEQHGTLRETLSASVRSYWRQVERDPGEHQVTYELTQYVLRRPELADVARKQYANYLDAATEFLAAVADAVRIDWTVPLPVLARYTHTVIDGATLYWLVNRDSADALAVLDELVEHLVKSSRRRRAARRVGTDLVG